jgi:D-alanyl-D-alanine carboxypeptidase
MGERKTGREARSHGATLLKLPARKTSPLVLVLLLTFVAFSGCGNDAQDDSRFSDDVVKQLDAAIAQEMKYNDLPGVVVGVWVPGEGEYVVARGKANLETGRRRTLDDPFRIGSITKTFVATAILQLVDRGKLSKSDKLSKWYPDIPSADQITIDDLLRMRSGLVESTSIEIFWDAYKKNRLADISTQDVIERAARTSDQLGYPPDQRTEYANINYVLLGEIVEKVSSDDLNTYITDNILKPLEMKNTIYPVEADLPGDLHGYHQDIDRLELVDTTVVNPAPIAGAGAMISDIWDLKTWAEAVCTGKLLEPETHRARLQTQHLQGEPDFVGYGEGIMTVGSFCGHGGDLLGFNSVMMYLPQRDATIVISVNRTDPYNEPAAVALFEATTRILFPKYVRNRW